jgi:hypothetical protein
MTSTNTKNHQTPSGIEDVAIERTDELEFAQDCLAGKRRAVRRVRFAEDFLSGDGAICTGSIAVSFAVVSRRRWPL